MTEHARSPLGSGRPWRRRGGRHARRADASARPAAAVQASEAATATATATQAKPGSFWREIPIIVVLAIAFSVLIKTFLAQAFYIPSISMEDTLLLNDRVVVNKLTDDAGSIERGDIVVFRDPGGWLDEPLALEPSGARGVLRDTLVFLGLAPSADEEDLIKRVIGIGGDHVVCCDAQGRITVNGVALDEQGYLFPGDVPSEDTFDVTVPPGSLWLLGDHRSRSADARRHQDDERGGMVPADGVIGRAFVLVWPLDRATVFATPRTFDNSAFGAGRPDAQVGASATAVPGSPAPADVPAPTTTP